MLRRNTRTRRKAYIGAAIGALAVSFTALPAAANEPLPDCGEINFPLQATDEDHRFAVTKTHDDVEAPYEEGTLRWAVEEANSLGGTNIIEIGADLEVLVEQSLTLRSGISFRSADPDRPATVKNTSDAQDTLMHSWHGELVQSTPIELRNLTFTGDRAAPNRGLALDHLCALGIFDTTVKDFLMLGVSASVGQYEPLQKVEVTDSTFTGLKHDPTYFSREAVLQINDSGPAFGDGSGATGNFTFRNTVFRDNEGGGLAFHGTLSTRGSEPSGKILIEDSTFAGNIGDAYSIGAIEVYGLNFMDSGGHIGEDMSGPAITIRDSLIQNNDGRYAGGLSVGYVDTDFQDNPNDPADISHGNAVRIERSTFANNRALAVGEVPPLDSGFGDNLTIGSGYHSVEDQSDRFTLLTMENSTFAQDPQRKEPDILFNAPFGGSTLEHVTLQGNGIRVVDVFGPARIALRASALDTGDADPVHLVSQAEGGNAAESTKLSISEVTTAYTSEPSRVPAGPGRIVAQPAEFALGELALDSVGKTPVMVPGPESVLLDGAMQSTFDADQRGAPRPLGPERDIGSVEAGTKEIPPVSQPSVFEIGEDQTASAGETMTFTVTRSNAETDPWTGEASVEVSTADGTAVAGVDYRPLSRTLTWAADDTAPKTVKVETMAPDENAAASHKKFTVVLANPGANAKLGDRTVAQGTITVAGPDSPGPGGEEPGSDGDGGVPVARTPSGPLERTGQEWPIAPFAAAGALLLAGAGLLVARRLRRLS